MLTIESLKEFGADTVSGLQRCMGNEALYLRLAGSVAKEPGFDKLKEAIDAGDRSAAFDAAHSLKGVLGNLSITPLYNKAAEISDALKAGEDRDYAALVGELTALKDKYAALI
ncbi:MAG: Hpt domain-containing protein [Lachnospiraceae bacterium]|nr:Hpt domain-containing protein [Lachnospiraceae bacterium]